LKAIGRKVPLPLSDPNCLIELDLPTPEVGPRDLLVQVKAVGLNPVDYKRRLSTELTVLGWDAAGVVESVGDETSLFKVGDEVFYAGDVLREGCDSELHAVDERVVGKKPKSLSFEQAAAMPLTTITAWECMFERLGISKRAEDNSGKSVLIIGGAGGVGSIAIQIAKKVAGLKVIATASRDETVKWCKEMGADETIDHRKAFKDEFEAKGLPETDYILCFNSTEKHVLNMADVIRPQGRICTIVETADDQPVNVNLFQLKSVGFMWELMFTRTIFQTEDMIEQHRLLNEASALFDAGALRSTLTVTYDEFSPESFKKAHALLEQGTCIGKIVIGGI
jgi:NADPH:quinone reductase